MQRLTALAALCLALVAPVLAAPSPAEALPEASRLASEGPLSAPPSSSAPSMK